MKTYTKEFKLTLVKLAESGLPTKELSKEYGVCRSTINTWRRSYRRDKGSLVSKSSKVLSKEEQRIKELEKQVRELSLERDILKKAAAGDLYASSP